MNWSIGNRILAAAFLGLALLVMNAVVSYVATQDLITSQHELARTHRVIANLEGVMSTLKDAETGERGYIITGDRKYLDPYRAALASFPTQFKELDESVPGDSSQRQQLPMLRAKFDRRLAMLKRGVELADAKDADAARQLLLSGTGKSLMDEIRVLISVMQGEERALLGMRDARTRASARNAKMTIAIANLAAAALVILVAYMLMRHNAARYQAEQELAQQREWLQVTLSSIGDAVISTDKAGRVSFMNPVSQALTGWSEDDARGQPLSAVFKIVNEKTRTAVDNPALVAMHEGRIVGLANHTLLITKSGAEIAIDDSGAPIRDARGRIQGSVLVFRDITERRKVDDERTRLLASERSARRAAEAASRAKDEFVAMISHELRTPLNAILGWAQMLRNPKFPAADSARAAESIERNAKTQARLIEDLLDISRIITGKLTLEIRPVDLMPVVEAAMEAVHAAADAKSIQLDLQLNPAGSLVSGDVNRLQQILWNLLSNAVKFTPRQGRIVVKLERVGSQLELRVSDTGVGIDRQFLPFVFDRFSQASTASERKHGGLGLGLAIVRHLVELHGGTVLAESDGEDKGATFTVSLPVRAIREDVLDAERMAEAPDSAAGLADAALLTGLRVLVLDDEPETRELLSTMLSQRGAEVVTCASAAEAFERVEAWRPSIVVSDISMPDEDGYRFIRRVRGLPPERGGKVPAVALTAFARSEDRLRALRAGFQMHVPKPVEAAELIMVVASLAERISTDRSSAAA